MLSHFLPLVELGNFWIQCWIFECRIKFWLTQDSIDLKKSWTLKELRSRDSKKENVVSKDFICQTTLHPWASVSWAFQRLTIFAPVETKVLSKAQPYYSCSAIVIQHLEGKKYFILHSLVLKADKIISAPNFPPYYSQVIAGWHRWTQQGVGSYHEQCRENVLVTVGTLTAPGAATIILEIQNKSHSNVAFNSTIKGEHTNNHPSLSSIRTQGYCRKISQH